MARKGSAALVMTRARQALNAQLCDVVLVVGDFNTFDDQEGMCYFELLAAAEGELLDVRDAPGVVMADGGRGFSSWEGWESNAYSRESAGGACRYDQMFISAGVHVARTHVAESRYYLRRPGYDQWVYASDHLPIVSDLVLPIGVDPALKRAKNRFRAPKPANFHAGGWTPGLTVGAKACLGVLGLVGLFFVALILWLFWEMAGGGNLDCRVQCRHKINDPPFDAALDAPPLNSSLLDCASGP